MTVPEAAELRGRHVVITGLGRPGQAGEVVARAFAEAGAILHLLDRGDDIAARAHAAAPEATPHRVDLTDEPATRDVARRIGEASGGRVAALVHLAGGFAATGPLDTGDLTGFERMMAINLTTAVVSTRAFLPMLRAAQGTILYIGSQAALPGGRSAGMAPYVAAKGALTALMRAVAQDEHAHGVTVNLVAPSALRTAANQHAMGDRFKYVEREAFAAALLQLCAPAEHRVTGQVIELS